MRKVTETVVNAFIRGEHKTLRNTSTDGKVLRLHGNAIARKTDAGGYEITDAGWQTVTTRDRLNGLLRALGIRAYVSQKDFALYYCDREWDGSWLTVL